MKLREFDFKIKTTKKKTIIIASIIVLVLLTFVTIYATQATYKKVISYDLLKGKVSEFKYTDIKIEIILVDRYGNEATAKEIPENYIFDEERSMCKNGSKITFNEDRTITINSNGKDKCTIYANWNDPVIPTVEISATKKNAGSKVTSNTWSSEGLNFTLTEVEAGESGATIYYCKDEDNTCEPTTEIVSGTKITAYNTLEQNIYYIRYKIVGGTGNTSGVQSFVAKVDNIVPTFTMRPEDGYGDDIDDFALVNAYSLEDPRHIYYSELDNGIIDENGNATTTSEDKLPKFGISGGEVVCYNQTYNTDKKFKTFNATLGDGKKINELGNNTIKCIATSNAKLSSEQTATYIISAIVDLDLDLVGITPQEKEFYDLAKEVSGQIRLQPGMGQYGPYYPTKKGCYKVVYNGTNITLGMNNISAIYNGWGGNDQEHLDIKELTKHNAGSFSYLIQLDQDVTDLEVKMSNPSTSTSDIIITKIKIMYLRETC